jgi:hypothetical protein
MKTLFLLIAVLFCFSVNAQTTTIGTPVACTPTITVDCNMNLTATVNTPNPGWVAGVAHGSTSLMSVAVQPDGVTFIFPTSLVLTPGLDYVVRYGIPTVLSGCSYSTYFIASPGWTAQDGTSGSVTYTDLPCATPAPSPSGNTGGGSGGNNGNGQGKGRK